MSDITQVKKGLVMIAKDLNKYNIKWTLGASLLLYLEGIDVTVTDIDIVVDSEDLETLQKFLEDYDYVYMEPNKQYLTEHFYSTQSNDIDVDIMVNFKVKQDNGIYHFPFEIIKETLLDGEKINLGSLQEWHKAYSAMERKDKVEILNKHFNNEWR